MGRRQFCHQYEPRATERSSWRASNGWHRTGVTQPIMSPLLEILVNNKLSLLRREDPDATEEAALGHLVAAYLQHHQLRVLSAAAAALEDVDLVQEAQEVRAW